MSELLPGFNNPGNYAELSKPFASSEESDKALDGFWQEFYELRNKYRLRDVSVLIGFDIAYEDGQIGQVLSCLHAGCTLQILPMVAHAYGRYQREHEEMIAKLVSGGGVEPVKQQSQKHRNRKYPA